MHNADHDDHILLIQGIHLVECPQLVSQPAKQSGALYRPPSQRPYRLGPCCHVLCSLGKCVIREHAQIQNKMLLKRPKHPLLRCEISAPKRWGCGQHATTRTQVILFAFLPVRFQHRTRDGAPADAAGIEQAVPEKQCHQTG